MLLDYHIYGRYLGNESGSSKLLHHRFYDFYFALNFGDKTGALLCDTATLWIDGRRQLAQNERFEVSKNISQPSVTLWTNSWLVFLDS